MANNPRRSTKRFAVGLFGVAVHHRQLRGVSSRMVMFTGEQMTLPIGRQAVHVALRQGCVSHLSWTGAICFHRQERNANGVVTCGYLSHLRETKLKPRCCVSGNRSVQETTHGALTNLPLQMLHLCDCCDADRRMLHCTWKFDKHSI